VDEIPHGQPWLKNEAKVANVLADDLWKRYGQHGSLDRVYLGFEVDNVESTSAEWDDLVAFYRTWAITSTSSRPASRS